MISADSRHHVVTVRTATENDDGEPYTWLNDVTFTCTAPPDADCRTYPACTCEVRTEDSDNPGHDYAGHRFVSGRECWVQTWFEAEPQAACTTYVAADADDRTDCHVPMRDRTGHVEIVSFDPDSGPEWEWS